MDQVHVASKHVGTRRFVDAVPPVSASAVTVPPREPSAAHDLAAVPATTAPETTVPSVVQGQYGTAPAPNGSPAAAAANASAPSAVLMPVPDRDEDSGEAVRQAARQRYLKTLADGLPCTGRELADMFGMSERWGRYQIRAARRTLTTTVHGAPVGP